MENDETIKNLIASQRGVPAEVLRGDTVEELTAHADALAAYMKPPSAPFVESDGYGAFGGYRERPSDDWLGDAFRRRV